jgi:hypothetical protein
MSQSREQLLSHFVGWTRQNITGDEKGEAQTFIDRLIKAFGQPGARDVGGTFEHRVKRSAAPPSPAAGPPSPTTSGSRSYSSR